MAIADYSKVIEIDPNYTSPYFDNPYHNRGNSYYLLGKYDLAIADYSQAIEVNPDRVNTYYYRGNAYLKQRKLDLARTDFEQAKQLFQAEGDLANVEEVDSILNQLP